MVRSRDSSLSKPEGPQQAALQSTTALSCYSMPLVQGEAT